MLQPNLNKFQATLLVKLFESLSVHEDADIFEYDLEPNTKLTLGSIKLGENSCVIFTLPEFSGNVLVALCKNNSKELRDYLANLVEYELENKLKLMLGDVVLTPQATSAIGSSPHSCVLLRTATSPKLKCLLDVVDLEIVTIRFLMVVPLAEQEWLTRKASGHDAMIDEFIATEKNLEF